MYFNIFIEWLLKCLIALALFPLHRGWFSLVSKFSCGITSKSDATMGTSVCICKYCLFSLQRQFQRHVFAWHACVEVSVSIGKGEIKMLLYAADQ